MKTHWADALMVIGFVGSRDGDREGLWRLSPPLLGSMRSLKEINFILVLCDSVNGESGTLGSGYSILPIQCNLHKTFS